MFLKKYVDSEEESDDAADLDDSSEGKTMLYDDFSEI